jgi:predicted RNase H-like HicB family nuclease
LTIDQQSARFRATIFLTLRRSSPEYNERAGSNNTSLISGLVHSLGETSGSKKGVPIIIYMTTYIVHVGEALKAVISVQKEGKFYVATDLVTSVADQGSSEEEAISRLKQGLLEHYQLLMELAPKGSKTSFIEIEVEKFAKASGAVS